MPNKCIAKCIDERIEKIISNLLRTGLAIASLLVLIGGAFYLVQHGGELPQYGYFHGEPAEMKSLNGVVKAALNLESRGIIQLGLLLLIFTPVSRVIFAAVAFLAAALKRLAESGVVEIHDITSPEQTERFVTLQRQGQLTCRVWMRPDLSRGEELKGKGLTQGMHPMSKQRDRFLRYGALKGYIDGIMGTHSALFFEPYADQPGNYGHYRPHTSDDAKLLVPNMEKMYQLIRIGHEAGFVVNVHAIGDKGVALMLDTYERLMKDLGHDLSGFRVIHAQVIRPRDFARFKALNVIAEVNPYHISDDMRWMEERIGKRINEERMDEAASTGACGIAGEGDVGQSRLAVLVPEAAAVV